MKNCFLCKELLSLEEFDVDNRKYQLKADMGTCKVCRKCELERAIRDLSTVKFNYETNKFEVIKFENEDEVREYYTNNKG
jgi:hypothetical protein